MQIVELEVDQLAVLVRHLGRITMAECKDDCDAHDLYLAYITIRAKLKEVMDNVD